MSQGLLNFLPPHRIPVCGLDQFPELPPGPVALDVESDGLEVLDGKAMPIGVAIADAHGEWYFPFGHREGKQHTADGVRRWLRDNLIGRDVFLKYAKYDISILLKWGVDLESLLCQPHDVEYPAALLDDRRRRFGLDLLAKERLGRGKAVMPMAGPIHLLPPDIVAVYARQDARLTWDLAQSYVPDIEREGLGRVLSLEDSLIYCVLAMERAGAVFDVEKAQRWVVEVKQAYSDRILELFRRTGLRVNPNSSGDMAKLFKYMDMSHPYTAEHEPSFTDDFLQKRLECPEVKLAHEGRQLDSLLSKYLMKYLAAVGSDGILRYKLHQLRGDKNGTITGRFASADVNIQQVFKPAKQRKQNPVTSRWIIRELFLPANGQRFLSADASQIEYRLFAHYSKSERLITEYNNNPDVSFHKLVAEKILGGQMIYDHAKNFNFMKLYGGGIQKIMFMVGCDEEEARRLDDLYKAEFPEAGRLMRKATRTAEKRGYVKTILGRRRRFQQGDRFYSALNAAIQGSAADLNKMNLLEVYNNRKLLEIVMRYTVHDELDGDVPHDACAKKIKDLLNEQKFKLRVPITWDVKTGRDWSLAA